MVSKRNRVKLPPNKRMQAARANAIWYGRSTPTVVDKVAQVRVGDAREPDAGRYAALPWWQTGTVTRRETMR